MKFPRLAFVMGFLFAAFAGNSALAYHDCYYGADFTRNGQGYLSGHLLFRMTVPSPGNIWRKAVVGGEVVVSKSLGPSEFIQIGFQSTLLGLTAKSFTSVKKVGLEEGFTLTAYASKVGPPVDELQLQLLCQPWVPGLPTRD